MSDEHAPTTPPGTIDWTPVKPVTGFWRSFDTFYGPGMTSREWTVLWAGTLNACAATVILWLTTGASHWFGFAALAWALLVSFDVFGGVMTLTTNSAKRWYNAPEQRSLRQRLSFVSLHLIHLAAIAFLTLLAARRDLGYQPWLWFVINAALMYGLTLTIITTPLDIQRPLAAAAIMIALFINYVFVPLPEPLMFFIPLFYLKLLLGYATIEAPWQTRPPAPPLPNRERT